MGWWAEEGDAKVPTQNGEVVHRLIGLGVDECEEEKGNDDA